MCPVLTLQLGWYKSMVVNCVVCGAVSFYYMNFYMTNKSPKQLYQVFECHKTHSGHAMVRFIHYLTKINVFWLKNDKNDHSEEPEIC